MDIVTMISCLKKSHEVNASRLPEKLHSICNHRFFSSVKGEIYVKFWSSVTSIFVQKTEMKLVFFTHHMELFRNGRVCDDNNSHLFYYK